MNTILSFFAGALAFYFMKGILNNGNTDEESRRANDYFKVQSPSERVKGHPIVGSA